MAQLLSFYDVKARKKFNSRSYVIKKRIVKGHTKKFAVVESSPLSGNAVWRVLAKDFKKE